MSISLASDAVNYAALFSPLEHTGWSNYDKQTRACVYIMSRILQIQQIRPLLLAVIRHFTPAEAKSAFFLFLSWSVRFLIAGGGGGGVLDQNYGLRAREIAKGSVKSAGQLADRMKGIVRTDSEFRDGVQRARVSKKHLARYYLRAIELFEVDKNDHPELGGVLEDTTVFNLEHVLPLSPNNSWSFPDDIVQTYSKRLGNMTLLDPTVNVDLGNKSFDQKKVIYKTSPLLITQRIAKFDSWGPEQIDERQKEMAEAAVKIWSA